MITRIIYTIGLVMLIGGATGLRAQDAPAPVAPALPPALTLNEAIKLAQQNNRSTQNAGLDTAKAQEKLAAFRTNRLPQFKFSSMFSQPLSTFDTTFEKGVFGTYPNIGPIPNEDTIISSTLSPTAVLVGQIQQPLSQLHRLNLQIKQLELNREIAREQLAANKQTLINEVKRAYYSILQTQSATQAANESVKFYRELDRITTTFVMQEVTLRTDQMDVQTKLAQAEYEITSLTNALTSQKEQLNHLLGRDVNIDFTVTDGMEHAQVMMRETELPQAQARALAQRPELRAAELRVESAKLDKRIKKSEYLPDVSLTFSYATTISNSNFIPRSITSVGVSVEWEIFDWGRKRHEANEKALSIKQSDNDLLDTKSQILMEVNQRYRQLTESCQLIRIASLNQNAARAKAQVATQRYRAEAALLKDVLQAQASLADANYEFQKALLSFWTAKADFEKALGEDK